MNCPFKRTVTVLLILMLPASAVAGGLVTFSYQGDLTQAGIPANEPYDIDVVYYTTATGNSTVGADSVTNWPVNDGVFSLDLMIDETALDIDIWMEFRVRPTAVGSYVTLSPRQLLKGAPFASRARGVANNSITSAAIFNGTIGSSDINQNEVQARVFGACGGGGAISAIQSGGGVTCASAASGWTLNGNSGLSQGINFLGTSDTVPLEIRTNDETVMRYVWATAPGGGAPNVAIIGGNAVNSVTADSPGSVIAGGGNQFSPNTIHGAEAFIGAGSNNSITASGGVIVGGGGNSVGGSDGAILGGNFNEANGIESIALGRRAKAEHHNTFVFNDGQGDLETTTTHQFLIGASNGVGIGTNNPSDQVHINAPAGLNAFRVQTAGTTRLRVHDNGGVSIGVNSSAVPGGLRVGGHTRVLGPGLEFGGVTGFNEVIARFETDNGGHTAISVDSESDQDAIVYFGENGNAKWGLRTDASDQGSTSGILDGLTIDESFELRANDNGDGRTFMTAQLYTNDDEAIGFPVDFVKVYGDVETERVYPESSGDQNLGLPGRRWSTVYLASQPNVSSDRRLKHEITPVHHGLDSVMQLKPVSYRLNHDPEERDHMGLIAQDVYEVIPQVISGTPDDDQMMSMRYPELIPVLIKAMQEQQQQIDQQSEQLQRQSLEIEQLKQAISTGLRAEVGS